MPLAFKKLPIKLELSIQEDYMKLYFPYVSQPKQHKQTEYVSSYKNTTVSTKPGNKETCKNAK